jgi:3-oxoacyl-(acyl-carrier-protein) synthase
MTDKQQRRVMVTGLGVVAPNGIGKSAFWEATRSGHSGITSLRESSLIEPDFSIGVAGWLPQFDAEPVLGRKLVNRTDRATHLALVALQEALLDACLEVERENPRRLGVVIANTTGGVLFVMQQLQSYYTRGPRAVSAYTAIASLQVASVGQASVRHGFAGYAKTPVNDTVGGLDALAVAYGAIRRGAADVVAAGGADAFIHPLLLLPLVYQGQHVLGDDVHGYRPFDKRAAGLILAEGAGICVLEEYKHAMARGAPLYGELIGYGQTNDANGFVPPAANGTQYARALSLALQMGQCAPQEVACMLLDGRALPSSDAGEAAALRLVFGEAMPRLPVSVPRTMLGHGYAAAGPLDTITALLALQHSLLPPTLNCEELDDRYGLNLVREQPRPLSSALNGSEPRVALVGGRALGGANVALAIKGV